MRFILSVMLAAAAATAAAASFAPSALADGRNPTLSVSALSRYQPFRSTTFTKADAPDLPPTWPFTPVTADGIAVSIDLSQTLYAETDSAVAQGWADFFDGLVHGPELSSLHAYFLTLREVQKVCGAGAYACYGDNEIIAPAQDPTFDLSAESVVTHEYGHHIAAHRINTPWQAIETGTKRWASYQEVCLKTRKHVYYPGAEDEQHYFFNPGEGFAEAYRVLNERNAGADEAPWDIVTNELYPDDTALALLQQDVTTPWTKNTTLKRSGSVTRSSAVRSFVVSTPLDGRLSVSLRSSAKAKFRLDILSPENASLAARNGRNVAAATRVCGERAVRVKVSRVSGAGAFRLSISRP